MGWVTSLAKGGVACIAVTSLVRAVTIVLKLLTNVCPGKLVKISSLHMDSIYLRDDDNLSSRRCGSELREGSVGVARSSSHDVDVDYNLLGS